MQILTRSLTIDDKQSALWVEAGAMPNLRYLNDVWDYFAHSTDGDLLGAFVSNKLVGIGKITRLYNGYGWLETLRVHPDYQNKGVGKAIWRQYFLEMGKLKLEETGMYTEGYNTVSKTLAESFGLSVTSYYDEYLLPVTPGISASNDSFTPVNSADGEALLSKYYSVMPPYVAINRTMYPTSSGLGEHLATMGWLYQSSDGGILIAGNRFHKERLLHLPWFYGSVTAALNFAQSLAALQGAPSVSSFLPKNYERVNTMQENGFTKAGDYMTLWVKLC